MIDRQTVEKVAQLAKLRLTEEEVELFSKQLSDILGFIEKLEELDTENILPFYEMIDQEAPLREDIPEEGLTNDDALKNAPQSEDGFFVVPRVVSAE
ncbi:MAG TPA: Asp-tRNA(Asn)/Glu-tRNA(Gln) amidotransferase subunit GatC [Persephonella sp.]|uniref:Aspartyl/glutamyl-tRNA(Asn/Gln) amidotransferase subunit C n=1 Tax=Persephonella marina (strain DSM 14350 / EX-H1) TaxID=123214 RepID=C0QST1_PERMH|nr:MULTISPECIES: Asp-tRNA(Asn)/Glu-tRNA(Gln) amidotransferase subunit GatC [Persephonella]ACO04243.1 glutamyl-tRNA(Gln) amidotransferase, C subunit [Persephonella marina EX-H1]HCB70635.1 Asp-tRNA(Asn)/Glu-tRNA(Gln) amidotransferase subunit GatC [Persephonella sp.]